MECTPPRPAPADNDSNGATDSYPAAPWQLRGDSVQAVRLIDIARARHHVPDTVQIVPIVPGKTLGLVYCASYERDSTLCYHELIVASALVKRDSSYGFWISNIYVDNDRALRGGHAIWKLTKQLAQFRWRAHQGYVRVEQHARVLCALEWTVRRPSLPLPLTMPVVTGDARAMFHFTGRGRCRLARTHGRLIAPKDSVIHELGLVSTRTLLLASRLAIDIPAPTACA